MTNNKMRLLLTLLIIFILFISAAFVNAAYAQSFKFQLANPASPAASVGSNFDVKVMINTAGKDSPGADAIIVFDSNKLGIQGATNGNFFTGAFEPHSIGGTTNKYLLSAWQTPNEYKSSSTDTLFGTITFNAKAAGSATLSFDCTSGSADSNIWDTNQTDILKCTDTQPLTLTIGGPGPTSTPAATLTPAATATPRPTSTPAPTNTPRPSVSELPRSGTVEMTVAALGLGIVLTVVGLLVIL